jgi:4-hydroxysphinganine ceramide fatty acyl 2-hydroxylase
MTVQEFSLKQVAKHNSEDSCWVIYQDKVYNVTEFIQDHPGGDDLILDYAGKDVTAVMKDVLEHEHSDAAYEILQDYCIGQISNKQDDEPELTLHEKRMKLLEGEEEFKTFDKEDFKPLETDINSDMKKNQFLDLTKALIPQLMRARYTKEFYLEQVHKPRYLNTPAIFFGHPLLEPLTKTAWYVIPTIWIPYVGYQLYQSLQFGNQQGTVWSFGLGIIIWTLLEYLLHRFFFHLDDLLPDNQAAFVVHFTIHGFHHYLPMDKLRLVMPPTLAVILAYPLVSLGHFLFPPMMAHAVVAGGFFGYVLYDCTHYYLHHARPFKYHFREMKKYHMAHHYKNYEGGYGITSKIWDYCFGTVLEYTN